MVFFSLLSKSLCELPMCFFAGCLLTRSEMCFESAATASLSKLSALAPETSLLRNKSTKLCLSLFEGEHVGKAGSCLFENIHHDCLNNAKQKQSLNIVYKPKSFIVAKFLSKTKIKMKSMYAQTKVGKSASSVLNKCMF